MRQLLRAKRSRREELASFEMLEQLIAQGAHSPALPEVTDAERALMAQEVRLACTQGVLLSLERLETWMRGHCGLANGNNACRCTRQIPVATAFGVLDLNRLEYARIRPGAAHAPGGLAVGGGADRWGRR